jgi:hypothetical protein
VVKTQVRALLPSFGSGALDRLVQEWSSERVPGAGVGARGRWWRAVGLKVALDPAVRTFAATLGGRSRRLAAPLRERMTGAAVGWTGLIALLLADATRAC